MPDFRLLRTLIINAILIVQMSVVPEKLGRKITKGIDGI